MTKSAALRYGVELGPAMHHAGRAIPSPSRARPSDSPMWERERASATSIQPGAAPPRRAFTRQKWREYRRTRQLARPRKRSESTWTPRKRRSTIQVVSVHQCWSTRCAASWQRTAEGGVMQLDITHHFLAARPACWPGEYQRFEAQPVVAPRTGKTKRKSRNGLEPADLLSRDAEAWFIGGTGDAELHSAQPIVASIMNPP